MSTFRISWDREKRRVEKFLKIDEKNATKFDGLIFLKRN